MKLKRFIELVAASAIAVMTSTSCNPRHQEGPQQQPLTYRIGGTVTGLTGLGLVLHSSLGEDLTITADGAFAFSIAAPNGAAYAVTVVQQPTSPSRFCAVTGGDDGHGGGTVHGENVTSLVVRCDAAVVAQRWQAPVTWGPVWQDDGHMVQHAYFGSTNGTDTAILEQTGISWDLVNGPLSPPKRLDAFPSGTRWGAGPFDGKRYQATAGDSALDLPGDMLVCAIVKPDYNPIIDGMEKPIIAKGVANGNHDVPGGGWVLMQMHSVYCFHYEALDEATQASFYTMAYTPTFFADQNIPGNGPLNPSYVVVCAGRSGNETHIAVNDRLATDIYPYHFGSGTFVLDSSGGHPATIGGYETDTTHVFPGRIYEMAVWDEPATPENIDAKLAAAEGLLLAPGDPALATYTRNREGPFIGLDGEYHTTWRHGPRIDPAKGFLFGLQSWNRVSYCTTYGGAPVACSDPTAGFVVAAGEALDLWNASAGATVQKDQLEPPGHSEKPSAELVTLSPGASFSTALAAFDSPGAIHGQFWIRVPAATTGTITLATSNPAVVGGVIGTSKHDIDLGTLAPNVWTRIWLKGLTTDGAAGTLTLSAPAGNLGPVTFYAWGVDLTQIGGGGDLGSFDPGPAMYDWSASIGRVGYDRVQDDPEHLVDVLELPRVPVSTASTGFCLSVDAQPYDGLGWDAPFVNPRGLVAWLHDQGLATAQLYATGGASSEFCFWVTGASGPTCWRPSWSAGSKHNLKGCVSSTGQMRLYADDVQVGSTVSGVSPVPDLADGHVAIGNNAGADPSTWTFVGPPSPWNGFVSKVLVCSDPGNDGTVATCR